MPYAHPTSEHFAPMFVTLGASGDPEAPPAQTIDGFWMGLAKRSFVSTCTLRPTGHPMIPGPEDSSGQDAARGGDATPG